MLNREILVRNIIQIYSLVVKDLKLRFRYKSEFFVEFIGPLFTMFFPYLIFQTLFNVEDKVFGKDSYYSKENFLLFLLLGFCISSLIFFLWSYRDQFHDEKIWKTISGVIIAPINKFNILIGHLVSGLVFKSFSLIFIIVLCYILYPIPIFNLIFFLVIFFCLSLTFAAIGFIIGLFEIVNEDISASLSVGISFISLVSCVYYPIQIFPEQIRFLITLNPLYYYVELLRLAWWSGINFEESIKYITIYHFLFVAIFTILTPLCASYLFLKLFHRYGITGY
jgi:ABC-type polysaccharide/polyol phosphate export permease